MRFNHDHGHPGFRGRRHRGAGEGEGWGHHRRGRRGRMFDGGELKLMLLKLIGEQPRHGYDLIRAIEERTGGGYAPSPGIVYPTLTLLGDIGLIEEQQADGNRKRFAITPAGLALLEEKAAELEGLLARLDAAAAVRERSDGVPIRRAMQNLRSVLINRLEGEGAGHDLVHDAVALIDEAARKIERL